MKKEGFCLILITIIYLFFRIGFQDGIMFGFDQPKISNAAIHLFEKKDFLNAMNYVEMNPIGQRSWYPFLLFFIGPLYLLTSDPVVVSLLIAVFNLLGVFLLYFLTRDLFNRRVALITCLIVAVSPWHMIFSNMVYNPSVFMTLLIFCYFLLVKIWKGEKWPWVFLPASISCMVQTYTLGFSSALAILLLTSVFLVKKVDFKKLAVGVLLLLFTLLPIIKYEISTDFSETKRLISPPSQKVNQTYVQRASVYFTQMVKITSFSDFEMQFTYSYNDFAKGLSQYFNNWSLFMEVLIILSFYYLIAHLILKKSFPYAVVFLWILFPLLFHIFYKTEEVAPRYFLVFIFPVSISLAFLIDNVSRLFSYKARCFLIGGFLVSVLIFGSYINIKYYDFLLNYNNYRGLYGGSTDPAVGFVKDVLFYIADDARDRRITNFVISSEVNVKGRYVMAGNFAFYWTKVMRRNENSIENGGRVFTYVISGSSNQVPKDGIFLKKFGPYDLYLVL